MAITRIRAADETWAFTSELYARVNAGLVVTRSGGVLIDTLPFPSETRQLRNYVDRLCEAGVKYVINTQSAPDHIYGSYMFPEAELLAHELARERLVRQGARSLRRAKKDTPELREVELRLPQIVFDESMIIRLGNKSIHIVHSPGPTPDTCVVYIPEEKVLFASDLMMHIPVLYNRLGNIEAYGDSLRRLHDFNLEVIVQGHGDILLRGEVTSSIERTLNYLRDVENLIRETMANGGSLDRVLERDVADFGISTIPMGDMVKAIHRQNLRHLWRQHLPPELRRKRSRSRGSRR